MSDVVEKLKAARELIARPGGWTQGTRARDVAGHMIDFRDGLAVSFCPAGALERVGASDEAASIFGKAVKRRAFWWWNDARRRTQAEVVAAFTKAIALAEAEGAANA